MRSPTILLRHAWLQGVLAVSLAIGLVWPVCALAGDAMVSKEAFVQGLSGPEVPVSPPGAGQMRFRGPAGVRSGADEPAFPAPAPKEIAVILHFKSGTTEIADDFSRRQLREIASALAEPAMRELRLEVGGHTDAVGSDAYNQTLSLRRAQAVKDALCRAPGVACAHLEAKGYGKGQPAASNDDEEGRGQNRRVVFKRLAWTKD